MPSTKPRVVESHQLYAGRIVTLRLDTLALPNDKTVEREVVEHRGAVAMVAVDEQERVLLVRQYRPAVGIDLLELPAGTLEPGEAPDDCARRELAEELELAAARWTSLAQCYSSPGFCTELIHLYLAEELTPARGQLDEDEAITVERLPLTEIPAQIAAGAIRDAKTIAGLMLALQRHAATQPAAGD
ncbi:MAG TPA: NUDIX hydrolase [Chloroflexota bacterium]|jgi:ADP-ribose pyrophosphatase|nr:NUDIX hydrolase [Chloroflexota bacterium]